MLKILPLLPLLFITASAAAQQADMNLRPVASTSAMPGHQMGDSTKQAKVKIPRVPFKYGLGMSKFRASCSGCHGKWGGGTDQGPPLMHAFYKPSHHSDTAFYRAVREGVKAHHWKFGDMPKVDGVTATDVGKILPFIRWLQKENGIY